MGTVLVTGANRGIGLAFARAYKARGHDVIGTARDVDGAAELAEVARVIPCDVRDDASVAALAQALGDRPIDLLINNAGILRRDDLQQLDVDVFMDQVNVNAAGPLRVTAALRANLTAAPAARVVNVTSRMGSIEDNTSGRMYGYRASKAALNMVSKSLAHDLRPIPVLAIHPGMVRTDMVGGHGDLDPDEAVTRMLEVIDGLDADKSGTFYHRDGYELPW